MAISTKILDGLYITDDRQLYRVIGREPNEKGEDWPFMKVWSVRENKEWLAHEDYLRDGKQCVDDSWPPNIGKPSKKPQKEVQESIFDL